MLSRFKFEIEGLFQEMYEKLPEYVFTREGITFADLQAAGLQSIVPIVNKLRENGRSDEYIRSHVFAFCEDELDLNSVQGEFTDLPVTLDIYKESIDMEFDVIVGNPPYQGKNKQDKLWVKFLIKSLEMTNIEGYVVMVTPNSWTKRPDSKSFSRVTNILKKKQIVSVKMDVSDYFEGVGEKIGYQIIKNTPKFTNTEVVVNGDEVISIDYKGQKISTSKNEKLIFNIFEKVEKSSHPRVSEYFSKRDASYDKRSIEKGKFKTEIDGDFNIPLLYTLNKIYYVKNNGYNIGTKFFFNFSGYYYSEENPEKYMPILEGYVSGQATFSIEVSNYNEANVLRHNYSRKLMRFYNDKFKTGGFNTGIPNLPWLGFNQVLSDSDLYSEFNLTDEEIMVVETEYGENL